MDTGTETLQSWWVLHAPVTQTASPSSGTAGNWSPVVYPPEEAEYSVVATAPFVSRTWPAVSAAAETEESVSNFTPG